MMSNEGDIYVARQQELVEEDVLKGERKLFGDLADPFPAIETVYDHSVNHPHKMLYANMVRQSLNRFLPQEKLFSPERPDDRYDAFIALRDTLPQLKWLVWGPATLSLSVYLLCKFRMHACKFFYEMISRWILPGKRVNISAFFAIDFRLLQFDEQVYTIAEVVVHFHDLGEYEQALRNMSILKTEIGLGVGSVYYAAKILEIKGMTVDEKTCMIQEKIVDLLHERPDAFDSDIFHTMQYFLVSLRGEFVAVREVRQLCRLVCYFYLMRRELRRLVELSPYRRHLQVKIGFSRLHLPLGSKKVMSVFVALNFLKDTEIFEGAHLEKSLKSVIQGVSAVPDSSFVELKRDDRIHALYLEIEKDDGNDFTAEEIQRLRRELPDNLRIHIQQLTRPVFMPRNEEEVMRSIVLLSQQLRYLRDIPQIVINFDEHTDTEISFTVIMLRVLVAGTDTMHEMIKKASSNYVIKIDRIRTMGTVRRKYPKESCIFRVKLPVIDFFRGDLSLDLYQARQAVLEELQRIFGEVRDYNGGMIAQQVATFHAVQKELGSIGHKHELLLENFFHSILPVEMRGILPPKTITHLFSLLLMMLEGGGMPEGKGCFRADEQEEYVYVLIRLANPLLKERILKGVESLHISAFQLPSVVIQVVDVVYIGYIYASTDNGQRAVLLAMIKQTIELE